LRGCQRHRAVPSFPTRRSSDLETVLNSLPLQASARHAAGREGKSGDADVEPYVAVIVAAPADEVIVAEPTFEGVGRIVGLVIVELSDDDHDPVPLTVESCIIVV